MSKEQKLQNSFNLLVALLTIIANIGVVVWFAAEINTKVQNLEYRIDRTSERVNVLANEVLRHTDDIGEIKGMLSIKYPETDFKKNPESIRIKYDNKKQNK